MRARSSEKGQALAIIILSIVAIFGFAALAVDLGRVYTERRRAQNAADAAALAAAQAVTANADFWQAGMDVAALNGLDNNETTNWVIVNSPPESGAYGPESDFPEYIRQEYYQVIIRQHVDPIFAQFIFQGEEMVTVEAVSRATYLTAVSSGDAVHALSTDDDALRMDGTVGIHVDGGNMVSDGGGIKDGGSGQVRVDDGAINISDTWTCRGCDANTVQPAPNEGVSSRLIDAVPEPYCPDHNEYDSENDVHYYYHRNGLGAGTLQPGIHCVNGNIDLSGQNSLTGRNVLIVMLNGGIKIRGGATLNLTADNDIKDVYGNQYGGMLLYAPPSNTSVLTLGGNTGSSFWGTIFAPGATCDMGGTAEGHANHTALICQYIKFHGTTDVNIVYNQVELYRLPAQIDLSQ